MKTKVINYRNSVTIYLNAGEKSLRVSTGLKIENPNNFVNGEFVKGEPDYKTKNFQIHVKQKNIDDLILKYIGEHGGESPSFDWLKEQLLAKAEVHAKKEKHLIVDVFDAYHKMKKNTTSTETADTYNRLKNILVKFCPNAFIEDVNIKFKEDFEGYLLGKYQNGTAYKRYSQFRSFMNWAKLHDYKFDLKILEAKRSIKDEVNSLIVAYTEDEVKQLKNLEFANDAQGKKFERTRDIMMFLIYTGMHWVDFNLMNKNFIEKREDTDYFVFTRKKTGSQCEVPICSETQKLIDKYNFNWGISEQKFNDNIKELLDYNGLCDYNEKVEYYKGNQKVTEFIKKSELVSSKIGRCTFTSILIRKKVQINFIMQATGWKKIEQIMDYLKIYGEKNSDFIRVFDSL